MLASPSARPPRRRMLWWLLLLILVGLLMALIGFRFWQLQYVQRSDNAYIRADVVWLIAPISGELIELAAREQQQVQQGSVLAVIKNTEQLSRVDQVNALTALKSTALEIHQQTESAQHAVLEGLRNEQRIAQQALSQLSQAQQRQRLLLKAGLVSTQSVEDVQAQIDSTAARIGSLNASIQAAEAQQQALLNRRSQLEQELQLVRQTAAGLPQDASQVLVDAPITGRVSSLSVQLNNRVSQGTRLMALTAPDSYYVEAWFDEPQVKKMQLGQPVDVRLDAYATQPLQGYIAKLQPDQPLPPLQNSSVRRLPVRIELLDSSALQPIRAGLAASVAVDLSSPIRHQIEKKPPAAPN